MAFSDNAEQEDKRNRAVVKKDFLVRQKWAVSENTDNLVRFVARMGDSDLKPYCDNSSNKACLLIVLHKWSSVYLISTKENYYIR